MQRYQAFFLPFLLLGTLTWAYLSTMAPGLTWAHFGADGGDLVTAAATGGIAHPSGYPTYLLLARLYQFLPLGSLAHRTNLLSASAAVLAVFFLYLLAERCLPLQPPTLRRLAALCSGAAFGFAPLFWSQAVIAEVYTLHLFFFALILYLCFGVPAHAKSQWLNLAIGLLFGLALGNHLTSLLLAPVIFGAAIQNWRLDWARLSLRLGGAALGGLVYLTLPLKAMSNPPINWGNPSTWDGFYWLVSGQLYAGNLTLLTLPGFLERLSAIAALIWGQFGLPGLLLGLVGLVRANLPAALNRSLLWISAVSIFFALLYSTTDSFLYLLPAFLCFALWIGAGICWFLDLASTKWPRFAPGLAALFLVFVLAQAASNWERVDASGDLRAEEFGAQALAALPADALVFARGDQAVFALWYFHFALGQRPDLVIISSDLLQFPWYVESLRVTYPGLDLPGTLLFESSLSVANSERPNCTVSYLHWTQLYCQPR
jgi:lipoprotein signal peptidase